MNQLHGLYCRLTGLSLCWIEFLHASAWYEWSKHFKADDLRLVIQYLRKRYRDNPGVLASCLRFRHLIVNIDYFAEYLAEARNMPGLSVTDRQSVLAASGRPTAEERPAKLAAPLAAALLAKLRAAGD